MSIDEKTRTILLEKLSFTPAQLELLEKNSELLTKTVGLIELIKKAAVHQKEQLPTLKRQLRKIRDSLSRRTHIHRQALAQARASYYTFQ